MIVIISRLENAKMGRPAYFVSGVARLLGVAPQLISAMFYKRELSDEICPVVG